MKSKYLFLFNSYNDYGPPINGPHLVGVLIDERIETWPIHVLIDGRHIVSAATMRIKLNFSGVQQHFIGMVNCWKQPMTSTPNWVNEKKNPIKWNELIQNGKNWAAADNVKHQIIDIDVNAIRCVLSIEPRSTRDCLHFFLLHEARLQPRQMLRRYEWMPSTFHLSVSN